MRTKTGDVFDAAHPYRPMTGHHNHVGWREVGKYKTGPGGMNCPCCTKLPPTKLKVKIHRYVRRKAKQELSVLLLD